MTNRFDIGCCYCRTKVEAGTGRVWKYGNRWYGCHIPCGQAAKARRQAERSGSCQGHPAGPSDPMGTTVYCDGTCRVTKAA